jgi:hypothetical protein
MPQMQTVVPANLQVVSRRDKNNPDTATIEAQLGRNAAEYLNEQLINSEDNRALLAEEYKKLAQSYQALVQWAQLQQQKEPHLQELLTVGLQSQAILQDPNLLADYHDRFFREVVDVPTRDIERYRSILTEDELLKTWVKHYYTNLHPELLDNTGADSANAIQNSYVLTNGQPIDWSKPLATAVNPDGSTLNYGQIHQLRVMLRDEKITGRVDEKTYVSRMHELDNYDNPAYEALRKSAIVKPPQDVQPQVIQAPLFQLPVVQQPIAQQPQMQRPTFPASPMTGVANNPGQPAATVPLFLRHLARYGGR